MALAPLSGAFQSLPPLPTIKLDPSGARSRPLWVSPTNSPVRLRVSPAAAPTPMGVFSQSFEALFSCAGCMVCFTPPLFLPVYLCTNVGPWCLLTVPLPVSQPTTWLGPPAATLPRVLVSWLPSCAPPTGLEECFFFISLGVGLPCSSIFCQFWLFFVFKLLLSFFWLCEEVQCFYLCLHLGQKPAWLFYSHLLSTLT